MEVMNSLLGGLGAISGGTKQGNLMPEADMNIGETGSFGGILSGMMSQNAVQTAQTDVVTETEAEVAENSALPILSDATLNALENLIGRYFKAAGTEDENGETDYLAAWSEILTNMSPEQIEELSQFSAMLDTVLNAENLEEEGEEVNLGDLLAQLINGEKEKLVNENKGDDIISSLMAGQYAMPVMTEIATVQLSDAAAPDNTYEAVAASDVLTEQTADETPTPVSELLPQADNEQIRQFAADFSKAVETAKQEITAKSDIITEVSYTESTPIMRNSENLASREIRYVDLDTETIPENLPKINIVRNEIQADDTAVQNMAVQTAQPAETAEPVVFPSEQAAAESVNTQTSEQILARISENRTETEQELVVKLNPKGLGEIEVKLTKSADSGLNITLAAHNSDVALLIRDHGSELVSMLENKGSTVSTLNVVVPAQEDQQAALNMSAEQNDSFMNQRADQGSSNGTNGSNGTVSISDEEEDDLTINEVMVSKEAKLWTTA